MSVHVCSAICLVEVFIRVISCNGINYRVECYVKGTMSNVAQGKGQILLVFRGLKDFQDDFICGISISSMEFFRDYINTVFCTIIKSIRGYSTKIVIVTI